ncbi:conserved Plasmodium protein, unknown function [Plasmodium berghei]|uniref:Uncharacterized protein n=2 Tax=Plasmodium berghei TaxID=5821 RepID=A0A509AM12_PLABA|nr:conserved Plasmodium protein, unknown function [Plasmodium berghei ANKA]CXI18192.1 conserved Plasmodium protein, unknown function [Plasmodium berghei]SCM19759.1 conserved Plasmodium protein, unknown function [Plasmodium berghei]SCN23496.1 conserved Plasmodium protein, unknown function [Plasmodium berghei]SCO59114.1 conserved Plasmodium protein, unknown function [Plasmodium berghei]SCO59808.1 conserved Plasmodium protein, unknown function [Plasmodium berghei]|eukprot:XP_034420627.1 conserved Plasmodium protein, unknown function [Plasmodium berghei ANKA]
MEKKENNNFPNFLDENEKNNYVKCEMIKSMNRRGKEILIKMLKIKENVIYDNILNINISIKNIWIYMDLQCTFSLNDLILISRTFKNTEIIYDDISFEDNEKHEKTNESLFDEEKKPKNIFLYFQNYKIRKNVVKIFFPKTHTVCFIHKNGSIHIHGSLVLKKLLLILIKVVKKLKYKTFWKYTKCQNKKNEFNHNIYELCTFPSLLDKSFQIDTENLLNETKPKQFEYIKSSNMIEGTKTQNTFNSASFINKNLNQKIEPINPEHSSSNLNQIDMLVDGSKEPNRIINNCENIIKEIRDKIDKLSPLKNYSTTFDELNNKIEKKKLKKIEQNCMNSHKKITHKNSEKSDFLCFEDNFSDFGEKEEKLLLLNSNNVKQNKEEDLNFLKKNKKIYNCGLSNFNTLYEHNTGENYDSQNNQVNIKKQIRNNLDFENIPINNEWDTNKISKKIIYKFNIHNKWTYIIRDDVIFDMTKFNIKQLVCVFKIKLKHFDITRIYNYIEFKNILTDINNIVYIKIDQNFLNKLISQTNLENFVKNNFIQNYHINNKNSVRTVLLFSSGKVVIYSCKDIHEVLSISRFVVNALRRNNNIIFE